MSRRYLRPFLTVSLHEPDWCVSPAPRKQSSARPETPGSYVASPGPSPRLSLHCASRRPQPQWPSDDCWFLSQRRAHMTPSWVCLVAPPEPPPPPWPRPPPPRPPPPARRLTNAEGLPVPWWPIL